jgi:hypothetical protein
MGDISDDAQDHILDEIAFGDGALGDITKMIERLNSGGKNANDLVEELEALQKKGFKIKIK